MHSWFLRAPVRPRVAVLALGFSAAVLIGCNDSKKVVEEAPAASVVTAQRSALSNGLRIAGQFLPFQEVELHAKVAGYVRHISVDIGDRVKAGQVLATLDVPELQAQVQGSSAGVRQTQEMIARAGSEVARAQANYDALHASSLRLQQASKARPGLIAEQDLDDMRAREMSAAAQRDAAKSSLAGTRQQLEVSQADHSRYASLAGYSRIVAPFSGVVTWRYADTGALIQAGTTNASSAPVVKIAQVDKLRLRLSVPESLAPSVHIGNMATIYVQSLRRTIKAPVSRTTRALDSTTRTMQAEIDVDNRDGSLSPGMYGDVSMEISRAKDAISVPISAVAQKGDQNYVLVVDSANRVQKHNVTIGLSTADRTEILSGLNENDRVIAANQASFTDGEVVTPKKSALTQGGR